MDQVLFNEIFDNDILPFIQEIKDNNSMIVLKDLQECKVELYREYARLNNNYKGQIFEKDADVVLLDRHKIASCVCGAFLSVSVFNKSELVNYIKTTGQKVDVYFFYVNEMAALYAATKFLSFFMVKERLNQIEAVRAIVSDFPKVPPITQNKRGFWNSVLFNLAEIKDKKQIGIEHYDMYSYAMFFFWLENYFNEKLAV